RRLDDDVRHRTPACDHPSRRRRRGRRTRRRRVPRDRRSARPGAALSGGRGRSPMLRSAGSATGEQRIRPETRERDVTDARATGRGRLYLVATPIGNLEDMTPRALRVLGEVALVAAENPAHTRRLLEHFGVRAQVTRLFEHNERARLPDLLRRLAGGESIA